MKEIRSVQGRGRWWLLIGRTDSAPLRRGHLIKDFREVTALAGGKACLAEGTAGSEPQGCQVPGVSEGPREGQRLGQRKE